MNNYMPTNLEKNSNNLETTPLSRLNQEEKENLNISIIVNILNSNPNSPKKKLRMRWLHW